MEQGDILIGHVKDLANRCFQNDYLTHTDFLSESEIAGIYDGLKREGIECKYGLINGTPCLPYGGREEAERKVLVFLPSYMDREIFFRGESDYSSVVSLIHVVPRNHRFTEPLSHRDYLGSLMQLGLERDKIGDILVSNSKEDDPDSKDEAYIYVISESAELIAGELNRVRHTSVDCEVVPLSSCSLSTKFKELSGSVASERLDAVLAMVFHLARGKAQDLISAEKVLVDGRICSSPGISLKENQKVSVRGFGKFVYEGIGPATKKGRFYAKVKLYC